MSVLGAAPLGAGVTLGGTNAQVTPAGRPVHDRLTAAENAFRQASAAFDAARAAQAQAAANREAAIGALKANAVLVSNTTVDTNPEVTAARARFEQAKVDLERTIIRAPVDGVAAGRRSRGADRDGVRGAAAGARHW